ncbi:MAG: class beta-lactamase [Actinomycetota bacterium]|nr:class beta-lactamase [Actinomycetota bacterium]
MTADLSRRTLLTGVPVAAAALAVVPGTAAGADTRSPEHTLPPCRRLAELEREYEGRIGCFALDVGTHATVGHRAGERFPFLSTFKVLAAGAVLRRARTAEPGLLEQVLHWTEADLVDYSPVTSEHLHDGMTVAQVCEAAIGHSDNTAGNLILARIGGPTGLTRFLRGLGDHLTRSDRWETDLNLWSPGELRDTTTPAAMAADLRALTVGRGLHPEDRSRLLAWMRGCLTGGARIRAGLPADWIVGDKTGSFGGYGVANDVAVAFPPGRSPLVLSIFTHRNDTTTPYDNTVVARAATILVEELEKV